MLRDTEWLVSTLQTIPALSSSVYVTTVPEGTVAPHSTDFRFVVIHPQDGTDDTDRLTGPNVLRHPRFTLYSVGADAYQAQAVAEAVKAKLVVHGFGIVPDVSGEWTQRLWYGVPTPLAVDRDPTPWWVFHTAEVGWQSQSL